MSGRAHTVTTGTRCNWNAQLLEVLWCNLKETLEDDRAERENYSFCNLQPVKIISKCWCYVLKLPLLYYESCSREQNWLPCLWGSGVHLIQHTVVKTTSNQCVHQRLSWVCCQRPHHRPQLLTMVETTTSEALNMGMKVSWLSNWTPRQVTTDDMGTWTASNVMDWNLVLASWCLEASQMKSVLSVFIFSQLAVIQVSIAAMHSMKRGGRLSHDSAL